MAWTDPTTAAVRQVLTAARWNTEVRDDLKYLKGQAGNVVIENTMTVGPTSAGASSSIRIGGNATGNRYAYFDLSGDDTYGDGLRVIRDNTGANTTSRVVHRGTGNFEFQTIEAADIMFRTNANYRGGVTATGNWGFGTTNPQGRIHVATSAGGAIYSDTASLGGTAIQVLPSSTVTAALTGIFVIAPSAGTPNSGNFSGSSTISSVNPSADLWNASGNIVRLTLSSGGIVLSRASGSLTYRVSLWLHWI